MASFRLYLEKNHPVGGGVYSEGAGGWLDITDRCHGIGQVTFAVKGDAGQLVISPPTGIKLNNRDGYFLSEPLRAGSDLEGGLEGRRARIALERAGGAEKTLGVFRVSADGGLDVDRDGSAGLNLESLAAALEDAEASQVSSGLGWYQQVPWTKAADMVRQPEAVGSLALPDAPLPYETLGSGISIGGRPGDFVAGKLNLGATVVATDVCYNEDLDYFVFSTLDALWIWRRDTGEYEEILAQGLAAIPDGWDILRVWYKGSSRIYQPIGPPVPPFYLVMVAQSEVATQSAANGSGYWQPKDQAYKWTRIRFYASSTATILWDSNDGGYKPALAPVVYREEVENGALGTVNNSTIGGEPITGGGWTDKPEHVAIPFGQYVAWLALRRTVVGEVPGDVPVLIRREVTYYGASDQYFDPIDGATNDTDNAWIDYPRPGAGSRQACNLDDIRMGCGYYDFYALWDATWNHDTNRDLGIRYSMGQGPLVDISFTHNPGVTTSQYDFWLAFAHWDGASFRYQIQVVGVRNGTDYPATPVSLDPYVMPTFVTCDVFGPGGGGLHQGGAVFFGWMDPFTGTAYRHYYSGAAFNVEGTESGLGIMQANTTNHGATPTFDTTIRAATFTPTTVADLGNRYYWTAKPAGGAGTVKHVSGRWVPVGCGFFREKPDGLPVFYRLALACFDRSECIPDPRNGRSGKSYRMLLVGLTWNTSGTMLFSGIDANGTFGKDTGFAASMPIMGVTKHGVVGSAEYATLDDPSVYFLSTESGSLFAMRQSTSYTAQWLGSVQASDMYLGLGLLAVKKPAHPGETEVAGVTNPTFPLTANTRWPLGEYYAWMYGPTHSGRLPLLDMADLTRWDALGLITMAGDSQFYFTRDGAPVIDKVPSGNPPPVATLTPSDYAGASRSRAPVSNSITRSVNDVVPGDMKVSVRLSPKSEWNLSPSFSGMGVYPIDLEVRCVRSGLVSTTIADDPRLGKTNWAWRETAKRVSIVAASDATGSIVWVENTADIEVGDRIIIDGSTQDLRVAAIASATLGVIILNATPTTLLKAGDTFWMLKGADGRFSSEYYWDDLGDGAGPLYRSASAVAVPASAGAVSIQVTTGHPFSVGCFFEIGKRTGLRGKNNGPYRVIRVRRAVEETRAGAYDVVEFEAAMYSQTGLRETVLAGDPIAVWLNMSKSSRSFGIGATGVVFTIDGGGGGDAANSTERAALEGDTVRLSYPGLVLKKNSQSKITGRDMASINAIGKKAGARVPANKLLDHHLAAMDVERRLRRGTDGRLMVELDGVRDMRPGGFDLATIEPLTILDVEDELLLPDRAGDGYKARFAVVSHSVDQSLNIKLTLEEVAAAVPTRPAAPYARGSLWTPADLPDLELWLRANSLQEQGLQDGEKVPFWMDESGNGRHAYMRSTTASTWPSIVVESGVYTVDFNTLGSQSLIIGDYEMLDNGVGQTIAVLGRKRTAGVSANAQYISKYSTNAPGYREWFMKVAYYSVQEVATTFDGNTQALTGGSDSWSVQVGSWAAGAQPVTYLDGALNATAVSAVANVDDTTVAVYVGSERNGTTNNLDGRVVEIIVTARPISADDLASLMAYMRREYGTLLGATAAFSGGFDAGFEV